ncbi:hypothetical protein H8356DRAFT_1333219 [Neocallimastix lanati (nom. inval.)]|nr:hypothetical protein H8356DRAFT_1333219 [Neocallimastix sp. JGI-2020a]
MAIQLLINCKLRRSQSSLHTARRCIPNVPTYISNDHEHQNGTINSSLVGVIIGDWKFYNHQGLCFNSKRSIRDGLMDITCGLMISQDRNLIRLFVTCIALTDWTNMAEMNYNYIYIYNYNDNDNDVSHWKKLSAIICMSERRPSRSNSRLIRKAYGRDVNRKVLQFSEHNISEQLLQPINNVFIINGIEKVIISQEINYTAFFGNLAYKSIQKQHLL